MSETKKNPKVFYLFLLIVPVIALLLFEWILRVSDYGHHYPLFVQSSSIDGYMQPNPNVIKRFFSNPDNAPNIQPDTFYFKQQKPKDSFRIVIQGGSTAAGFPFGRFGSLQGMLQQRFKRLYPDKTIEVISTAMSAINSYTLLDFTDEIIAIKPDLILIYAGHNEFLGIMGVGSAFASKSDRATTLMFLKLKDVKLFQLMQSFVALFQNDNAQEDVQSESKHKDKRTLMAQVAKKKNILINSEVYHQGVEQFEENLKLILSKYQQHNIPVLISTLVSNEKDQTPFVSSKGPYSADSYFSQANAFITEKRYKKAKQAFVQARDRDLLRFRAPSQFNTIIKKVINGDSVQLIDVQQAIRRESPHKIIGNQHMFEHLHPNARGYFLLAEAFIQKIIDNNLISNSNTPYSRKKAWADIPLTDVDLIAAEFKIKTLVADYPFTEKKQRVEFGKAKSFEEKTAIKKLANADWLELHQEMLSYYQQTKNGDKLTNLIKAAKVAGLIFDAFPNQGKAAWVAGQIHFSINDTLIAEYYFKHAVQIKPNSIEYLMSYAYSLYFNKKPKQSLAMLKRVLLIDPEHPQANQQKQRISKEVLL